MRDKVAQVFQCGARAGIVAGLELGLKFIQLRGQLFVAAIFVHPEQFRVLPARDDGIERQFNRTGFFHLGASDLVARFFG